MSGLSAVAEVELRDDVRIVLTIAVDGFEVGTPIELSGTATQANGAIATFYDVQNLLPPASPGGGSLLTVTAVPLTKFVAGEAITVFVRAAKIWGTVLQEDPGHTRPGAKVWKAEPETQSDP